MAAHSKKLAAVVIVFAAMHATAAPPTRVISLVPALTEMLFAIGAGRLVVGVGSYDEFPPEVKSLPRVGALLDPDMERMLSLRPDLALVYGSQSDLQAQLARAGVRTYNYRHAGVAGVFRTLDELGALLDRKAEADRVARDLRAQIDAVAARVRDRPRPRTLLVFERDPSSLRGVYVSGGRGFLHDVLEAAGGANVFADVDRESVQPSLETLLARAPEVIVEVQATGVFGPEKSAAGQPGVWAPLASVPAVRDRRVHHLVGQYLVVPGPRLGRAAETLARVLHPEAFQ
jgi:iron complex transport system substrate-binding protein